MIHDKNKFSRDDEVRVVKMYSFKDFPDCDSYDNVWNQPMDTEIKIGDVLTVSESVNSGVYFCNTQFGWPSSCFELYDADEVMKPEPSPDKIYAIWNYDQYPFALSSEVNTMNSEMVTVFGYGGMRMKRKNVVIVDFDPEPILNDLRRKFDSAIQGIRDEFKQKALNTIPKLKRMNGYRNV